MATTYRIVVMQDQESWDLLDECSIVDLSEEDYVKWCEASGHMQNIKILPEAHTTATVTVNKGVFSEEED